MMMTAVVLYLFRRVAPLWGALEIKKGGPFTPPTPHPMLRLAVVTAAAAILAEGGVASPPALVALPLRANAFASAGRRLASTPTYPLSGSARDQGVFTVPLALGTPPQVLNAIVDTGSTLTAFTCAGCAPGECGTEHGVFNPDASATAVRLSCTDPACECGAPACTCGVDQRCAYRRMYAEGSSTAGALISDGMSLPPGLPGSSSHRGGNTSTTARLAFGCALKETGSIKAQPAAGIAGLGADGVGLVDQLAEAGVLTGRAFSLCLAPPADGEGAGPAGGALLLGPGLPDGLGSSDDAITTPLIRGQASFYTIKLEAMALGDGAGAAPLDTTPPQPEVWEGGMGVVLDSGTTYTYLPTPAYTAFRGAVGEAATGLGASRVKGADPAFPDVCWGGLGVDAGAWPGAPFPNLTLTLAPATPLSLPPRSYLFPHPAKADAVCLGVFDNGGPGTILGGITFLDTLVQLDRSGGSPGVARFYRGVDCAGLGAVAEAGMQAAGAAAEAPSAGGGGGGGGGQARRWLEIGVAAGVLITLGSAMALLCRRRHAALASATGPVPPGGGPPTGDARWWKWPNFAGNPVLPARLWWMPDYRTSTAGAPGLVPGRQWDALEGEGHADSALGLAAPVSRSGIVVTPVEVEEVELRVLK